MKSTGTDRLSGLEKRWGTTRNLPDSEIMEQVASLARSLSEMVSTTVPVQMECIVLERADVSHPITIIIRALLLEIR